MYSVADMLDLFSNKFSGLRRRRFTFSFVSTSPLQGAFFRHFKISFSIRYEFKRPRRAGRFVSLDRRSNGPCGVRS